MDLQAFIKNNYMEKDILQSMYLTNQGVRNNYITAGNLAPNPGINAYMSMNPIGFQNGTLKRDTTHVKRLNWLYIDLDTYNTQYSKDQILMNLEENYYNRSIPIPTYVIDSGRGMYLLWKINENPKAAPRWIKVQKYLHEVLKEFGADHSVVTDRARVLRQIGSVNSKSGTAVKVLSSSPQKTYTLYEIMQEYVPAQPIAAAKTTKKSNQKVYTMGSVTTMLVSRLKDLETLLLQYRDAEHTKREKILFLYRYWNLYLTDSKKDSLNRALELNNKLKHPLSDKEVTWATKSAEKYYDDGCTLRMRNSSLIEFLDITEEEQKDLYTILSTKEKKERKQARNRKYYRNQLSQEGKQTKEKQIKDRHRAIWKLLKEGKKQVEICQKLNISRSTFYADKKVIECSLDALQSESESIAENPQKKNPKQYPKILALVLKDDSPSVLFPLEEESKFEFWDCTDQVLVWELPFWTSG